RKVSAPGSVVLPLEAHRPCLSGPELYLRHVHPSFPMGRLEPGELCDGALCDVWTAEAGRACRGVSAATFVQAVRRVGTGGGVLGGTTAVLGSEARGSERTVVDRPTEVRQCHCAARGIAGEQSPVGRAGTVAGRTGK